MRDWRAFVRARLRLDEVGAEREWRIVRELAAQLEDFHSEARARGATDAEADAYACAQVPDWEALATDLRRDAPAPVNTRLERFAERVQPRASLERGALLMFAHLFTDLRHALRQMRKSPAFTIVATLTLAVGVGATTAIFSVINGVLLRPLPYPDAERLVRVFEVVPQYGRFSVAPANFLDWRQRQTTFERLAAHAGSNFTFVGKEGPERIVGALVSWDMFQLLGVPPALGRGFRSDEDAPKQNNVVVLSHGAWQRRFGGDPNVVGRSVTLSGTLVTIVGVMPAGFYFPTREAELWRPIAFNAAAAPRGAHFIGVVGRLRSGTSLETAGAEMRTIAGQLAEQYPQTNRHESAETIALHDAVIGPIRPMLLTLLGAVVVVVLIACANVANLLLVRASVREKEIAIRAAIGAGRRRLVMQMLAESLVLALVAGALGVLFAWLMLTPIQLLGAGSIPRVADVTVDANVLAFGLLLSLVTGLLFGLAPSWQTSGGDVGAVLKEGGRGMATARGRRVQSALLVGEVALSIVLLAGATLLLRSFAKLTSVEPGFDPENVLTFSVALPQTSYPNAAARATFFDRLLERLQSAPGVQSAAMVQQIPIQGSYTLSFNIDRRAALAPADSPAANHRVVSPGYFAALQIPVLRGRAFTPMDAEKSPLVAVVDEAFVAEHFPNEDPIGRGIDIGNGTDGYYQIVGVVGSVRHEGLDASPAPTMYVPYKQDIFSAMWVVVRTAGDPAQFAATARQMVREIDGTLPAFAMTPLTQVISDSVARRRFAMLLLAVFAGVALFLAAVGLYGLVAYAVSQRTQEIGLRMAIGAARRDVLAMVLGSGMKLVGVGIIVGLAAALAVGRVIASMLFATTPYDAASYALTVTVLLAVSALACYLPARRAMDVDPVEALRQS